MKLSYSAAVCRSLVLLLATLATVPRAQAHDTPSISETGPDANVKRFDIPVLEANVRGMLAGPERDYFAGVLANAENRIRDLTELAPGSGCGCSVRIG